MGCCNNDNKLPNDYLGTQTRSTSCPLTFTLYKRDSSSSQLCKQLRICVEVYLFREELLLVAGDNDVRKRSKNMWVFV